MKQEILDQMGFKTVDGVYVLKHDVVNVHPDRRYKRAFHAEEVWKEGTLICVKTFRYNEIYPPQISAQGLMGVIVCREDNRNQWEPLLNALVTPSENYCSLRAVLDFKCAVGNDELVARILELGLVSYQRLMDIGLGLAELSEDDYLEWRKRVMQ